MKEKSERNKEIYEKNKSGVSYSQLMKDYSVSFNTIAKIVQRYKLKEKNGTNTEG